MKQLLLIIILLLPATLLADTEMANTSIANSTNTKHRPWLNWQLTESDWQHYQRIIKGPASVWYINATPLQVLAVQSDISDHDLVRLARIEAELDIAREAAEVRFQIAYNAAREKLRDTEQSLWDSIRLPSKVAPLDAEDVIVLLDVACRDQCVKISAFIKTRARRLKHTHLYFMNTESDANIQTWAMEHRLPIQAVRDRIITLNNAKNNSPEELGVSDKPLPLVLIRSPQGGFDHVSMD